MYNPQKIIAIQNNVNNIRLAQCHSSCIHKSKQTVGTIASMVEFSSLYMEQ